MRTVALEEHFSVPAVARRIDPAVVARRGFRQRTLPQQGPNPLELLPEIGEKRLKSMDESGVDFAVLSNSGPGADLVGGEDGVVMAREFNDYLADVVKRHPTRFGGFAALPMQTPDAAAKEFVRSVKQLGFVGAMIHGTIMVLELERVALPRPSKLRSDPGGGGRSRRADLHSSPHSAGSDTADLFREPAGGHGARA